MRLERVHHIGIRVSEEAAAVAFYERFGFRTVYRDAHDPVLVLVNDTGVELNLVVNAVPNPEAKNPLMDAPVKLTGYTHIALEVESIEAAQAELMAWGIPITEGPRRLGAGMSLFIRDPDANVLELRQNLPPSS